jgi:diaminopimelate decarboxylase
LNELPRHAPMDQFPVIDGCLQVGGMPLPLLAESMGNTPFYVYDRGLLSKRAAEVRQALPTRIKLHYAMKANPMPDVVSHLVDLVDGIDVASGGELTIASRAGMPASRISFAGPGKRDPELVGAMNAGVLINVESANELRRIARIADASGITPRLAVRINPDFDLKSSGMRMGGGPKPFGVDAEQVPALLAEIGHLGLSCEGFHIFGGSQNLRAGDICAAQSHALTLAFRLATEASMPLRVLNIGGGFGIPYFPGDLPLDLPTIGEHMEELVEHLDREHPSAELIIELGRYLVAEAGLYVCRVIDRKVSRGHTFLVADGGMHHHLAASGNFGQVIRKNFPVAIGNRMDAPQREIVSIVGPLCTPLDILADRVELPVAEVGDLVVIYQSGAYGLTASPTAFLHHPHPAERLL